MGSIRDIELVFYKIFSKTDEPKSPKKRVNYMDGERFFVHKKWRF